MDEYKVTTQENGTVVEELMSELNVYSPTPEESTRLERIQNDIDFIVLKIKGLI